MRSRFDKFTDGARRVLALAQEEAQRLNHTYIAPVHLLLGVVREGDGVGAQALANHGITPERAHRVVEQVIERRKQIVLGEIGLTQSAKRVIELTVDEARRLGDHDIGTEHLLLGLLRSDDEALAEVLRTLGIVPDELRAEVEATPRPTSPVDASSAVQPPDVAFAPTVEQFTERGLAVLRLAQEEAQRFNHNYIGTEHLLLGLVREGHGDGAKVLNTLGVELNKVRSAVEFIIGRGDRIVLGEISLTPRSKKVVALAMNEAARMHHPKVGTAHLLLGMVREGDGIAAGVLQSMGVNLERVREQTLRILAAREADDQSGDGPEG